MIDDKSPACIDDQSPETQRFIDSLNLFKSTINTLATHVEKLGNMVNQLREDMRAQSELFDQSTDKLFRQNGQMEIKNQLGM